MLIEKQALKVSLHITICPREAAHSLVPVACTRPSKTMSNLSYSVMACLHASTTHAVLTKLVPRLWQMRWKVGSLGDARTRDDDDAPH